MAWLSLSSESPVTCHCGHNKLKITGAARKIETQADEERRKFSSSVALNSDGAWGCHTQLELKLKLASLVGQGKTLWLLPVPKMVEQLFLKVTSCLFWIDFIVKPKLDLVEFSRPSATGRSSLGLNFKISPKEGGTKAPQFTACKGLIFFSLGAPNLQGWVWGQAMCGWPFKLHTKTLTDTTMHWSP